MLAQMGSSKFQAFQMLEEMKVGVHDITVDALGATQKGMEEIMVVGKVVGFDGTTCMMESPTTPV